MAQEAAGWISPLRSGIPLVDKILNSLSQWLNAPTFPGGITVGNGTPASYSSTTGAQTAPMPVALNVDPSTGLVQVNGNPIVGSQNGTQTRIQAGTTTVTTNASGIATISYTAFPTGVDATLATPVDTSTTMQVAVNSAGSSNGTLAVVCRSSTGALVASSSVQLRWLAIGH